MTNFPQSSLRRTATLAAAAAVFALYCAFAAANASAAACAVPSGGYPTIASAIADNTCDPINIAAGTYAEALDITRSVTIHGAGSSSTTIAPTSQPTEVVGIRNAATVAIDGFTIRYPSGFYVPGNINAQSIGVHVYEGATAEIFNNVITEIHNASNNGNQTGHCVMVGNNSPASTATVNLHDNTITYCQKQGVSVRANSTATIVDNEVAFGNQGDGKDPLDPNIYAANGIVLSTNVTAIVTGNDVHDWICTPGAGSGPACGANPLTETQSVGILPFGNLASVLISGNNVHDNDLGFADYLNTTSTSIVTGNLFVNNDHANAQIYGSTSDWTGNTISGAPYGLIVSNSIGTESTLAMTGNVFQNNTNYAIFVDSTPGLGSITASDNQFVNNANGSDVTNTNIGDMQCNWWGSTSGPAAPGNPGGSGDILTTGASYSPWAYSPTTYECGPATPQGTLAFAEGSAVAGTSTTLVLTLTNVNAQPISNTDGSFTLPSGISVTGVSGNTCGGSAGFGSGQDISFSGAQIPAAGSCTISFVVAAGSAGTFSVTLPAGNVLSPRGGSTGSSTATITVTPAAALPLDPIPACIGKELLLTDVALTGSKVRIKGFARLKYAGQRVALRFKISGSKVVGYATVQSDGSFTTLLKRPARNYLNSGNARYQAAIGGGVTQWIKLKRRMGSTNVTYSNGAFDISGSVTKPLARGARLFVTISSACEPYKTVGTLAVNQRSARFAGSVVTSQRNTVVLARLRVKVRSSSSSKRQFSTYSILQPVVVQ